MSRQLKQGETWSFQIAYFLCEARHRPEYGDIEVQIRAGDNHYHRLLCNATKTIDEIKVYTAKKICAELNRTLEIVDDYVRYWSNPHVPTT